MSIVKTHTNFLKNCREDEFRFGQKAATSQTFGKDSCRSKLSPRIRELARPRMVHKPLACHLNLDSAPFRSLPPQWKEKRREARLIVFPVFQKTTQKSIVSSRLVLLATPKANWSSKKKDRMWEKGHLQRRLSGSRRAPETSLFSLPSQELLQRKNSLEKEKEYWLSCKYFLPTAGKPQWVNHQFNYRDLERKRLISEEEIQKLEILSYRIVALVLDQSQLITFEKNRQNLQRDSIARDETILMPS